MLTQWCIVFDGIPRFRCHPKGVAERVRHPTAAQPESARQADVLAVAGSAVSGWFVYVIQKR